MEFSCGAVLYKLVNGVPYYVLVLGSVYGFPKGHMETGETERETAEREVCEETGLKVRVNTDFRREVTYYIANRSRKTKRVVFFLAEYDPRLTPKPCHEIRGIAVKRYEEAMELLPYAGLRGILEEAHKYILESKKQSF